MKIVNTSEWRSFFRLDSGFFLEIRQDSRLKTLCQPKKSLALEHIPFFKQGLGLLQAAGDIGQGLTGLHVIAAAAGKVP